MEKRRESLATYEQVASLGQDMRELEKDPRFIRIFGEHFIEAFAITNVMQLSQYDAAGRARSHEKMLARSHLIQFIESLKNDGIVAQESIDEISRETEEYEGQEDEEYDNDDATLVDGDDFEEETTAG